jgi:hypothetical protein
LIVPFWALAGSGMPNSSNKNSNKVRRGITVVCPSLWRNLRDQRAPVNANLS